MNIEEVTYNLIEQFGLKPTSREDRGVTLYMPTNEGVYIQCGKYGNTRFSIHGLHSASQIDESLNDEERGALKRYLPGIDLRRMLESRIMPEDHTGIWIEVRSEEEIYQALDATAAHYLRIQDTMPDLREDTTRYPARDLRDPDDYSELPEL